MQISSIMSLNNLINQYLERRGFLDQQSKNFINVQESCDENDQRKSARHFLIAYSRFLKCADKNILSKLGYLNFQIFNYLNSINITDFIDQSIFIDDKFPSRNRDFKVFDEISKFSNNNSIENFEIKSIFDKFLLNLSENIEEINDFCDQTSICEKSDHQRTLELDNFLQKDDQERISQSIVTLKFEKENGRFSSSAISNDRKMIALGDEDGFLTIYDENEAKPTKFKGHSGSVFDAKFLQDQEKDFLFTCSQDHSIKLWDISPGQTSSSSNRKFFQYTGHSSPVFSLDVHHSGQFFASGGSSDRKICLYNVENLNPLRTLCYHSQAVQCVKFSDTLLPGQQNPLLVTTSLDRKICLWSLDVSCPVRIYHFLNHHPTMLAYHPTKHMLFVGSRDRKLTVMDVRKDQVIQTLDLDHVIPYCLDFDRSKQGDWSLFFVGGTSVCQGLATVKRLRMSFDDQNDVSSTKLIKSGLDFDVECGRDSKCQTLSARDVDYPHTVAILTM